MNKEIVHVMLKPDTLEFGMRDVILSELLGLGGKLIVAKRLILSLAQISEIYFDFDNERAKKAVFHYFTTRETEHLAFIGEPGIHQTYQQAKGRPGKGGIRGKYYTRYTKLTPEELANWFRGTLANIEDIDLEMFARDILHIPNSVDRSKRGLLIVLDSDQIQLIEGLGIRF
jgi:nucleoside diphosphate kinase